MIVRKTFPALIVGGALLAFSAAPGDAGWFDWLRAAPAPPPDIEERAWASGDVGIAPGQSAPDFRLSRLGGGTTRLSAYQGKKWVLLNFWATWCAPCRREMPSLQALSRAYADRGLLVLGVNIDSDEPEAGHAAALLREAGVTFPVAFDPRGEAAARYAVHGLPVTYLIDRRGLIVKRMIGEKDWTSPQIRAYLNALVQPTGE